MSYRPVIRSKTFPYHVTARSNNREWFPLPMAEMWNIFREQLGRIANLYEIEILTFVLMSNHFHLLVRSPGANLSEALNYLLREVSFRVGARTERINHVFGGRNKKSLITTDRYFRHVYRYVYRNPVDAGIVERVEDYPYSTLTYALRGENPGFRFLGGTPYEAALPQRKHRLSWLNEPYPPGVREVIERALRRSTFAFPVRRNDADLIRLADSL